MDIKYQYYNEIVLTFKDYETDFRSGVIVIYVPDDSKPFDIVCQKIMNQIDRIAATLDPRDQEIVIEIQKTGRVAEFRLEKKVKDNSNQPDNRQN